ncbi:MAG: VCBS repeat-containing protein, partial [Oscillospiraceae bacterium]|nr:VCBS repeat-containing protein [Oscillospiraceae bacterium]
IGTEKEGPCRRFALDGSPMETVWEGPGGVMTMVQVPGRKDQFLATQEFYSPNCGGDDARIVTCTKQSDGTWQVKTLCDLPYVHRFGLIRAKDGRYWLLACTIKSACEYKEDWRSPGKIFAACLPENLDSYDKDHQLSVKILRENQLKNHGYYTAPDKSYALVSTDEGVFRFEPPVKPEAEWEIRRILQKPVSDICQADFDGDGKPELLTLSPFHGEEISIFRLDDAGVYQPAFQFAQQFPFLHAIWSGSLNGTPCALVGHRKGERNLLRVYYNNETQQYEIETVDHDRGPTNVWVYSYEGKDRIISANRETDEVALYTVEA